MKKQQIILMDFSGVYERQQFWNQREVQWIRLQEISGTNCYCDEQALKLLQKKIKSLPLKGIHYIDSGNYHYMSRIWLEKLSSPFGLIVFDHHTDMQPPAFGGLLSCGGWIASALTELENLKEVLLIGPDPNDYAAVDSELQKKVKFFGKDRLKGAGRSEFQTYLQTAASELSWYYSIDKDILCRNDADTAWSQGDMTLEELLECLKLTVRQIKDNQKEILGVDICGEEESSSLCGSIVNEKANLQLLKFFERML